MLSIPTVQAGVTLRSATPAQLFACLVPNPRGRPDLPKLPTTSFPEGLRCETHTNKVGVQSTYLKTARFVERGVVARGGMNLVLRAFDTELQREVAVKRVLPEVERQGVVDGL